MEWLTYLLKVSACTVLFYALYYLFLQRLTFFSLNRFYLLSALVISFLIPGLELEIERPVEVKQEVAQKIPISVAESFTPAESSNTAVYVVHAPNPVSVDAVFSEYSWQEVMNTTYWLIAATMLTLFIWQMVQLLKHIVNVNKRIGNLKVVYKPEGFTNCSFLNYVFVDQQELTEDEIMVILQHEAVHANRLHSLDKLFVHVCKVLLWFNPMIYLYAQALEQVHEYEADQEASSLIGSTSYANLLLTIAVRRNNLPLVHNFVQSPLKARIKMLFTNQSKSMKKLMYLLTVPACLALGWLFAVQVVYAEVPKAKHKTIRENTSVTPSGFIEVKNTVFAGSNAPAVVIIVSSPNGKQIKIPGKPDVVVKFFIDNRIYSLEEAKAFNPSFLKSLSPKQGFDYGRQYDVDGIDEKDRVIWFGKEPAFKASVIKAMAYKKVYDKKYVGKTLRGKMVSYSYMENNTTMNGFIVRLSNGEEVFACVPTELAATINSQLRIGDDITLNDINYVFYHSRKDMPAIASGTYMKGRKIIFDRNMSLTNRTTTF